MYWTRCHVKRELGLAIGTPVLTRSLMSAPFDHLPFLLIHLTCVIILTENV